jgi:hypothetical protein
MPKDPTKKYRVSYVTRTITTIEVRAVDQAEAIRKATIAEDFDGKVIDVTDHDPEVCECKVVI